MLNGFLHLHSECNLPLVQQLIVKGFAASQLGFSIKQSDVFWFPSLASHLPCIYFFCEFNLPFGQTDVDWFSSLATLLACNVTFYSELNLPFVRTDVDWFSSLGTVMRKVSLDLHLIS